MRKIFIISFLVICSNLFSQQTFSGYSIRLGAGSAIFTKHNIVAFNIENELSYKLNDSYELSATLNSGRSDASIYQCISYFQGGANAYILPFGRGIRNDLKFGFGVSLAHIAQFYNYYRAFAMPVFLNGEYEYNAGYSPGISLIAENDFKVSDKCVLSLKAYSLYNYGYGVAVGAVLKVGIKL